MLTVHAGVAIEDGELDRNERGEDGVFVTRAAIVYANGTDIGGSGQMGFGYHLGILNCQNGIADNCDIGLDAESL